MADYNINFTSTGGDQVERQIDDILKRTQSTSTEIISLSKALGTSAKNAARFAEQLGMGAADVEDVVRKMLQLKDAGYDAADALEVLQRENGLTVEQFNILNKTIGKSVNAQKALADAQEQAAASARKQEEVSAAQLMALEQINEAAKEFAASLQGFASQAIGEFISFDDALTGIQAKTGRTREELEFLTDAIREVALTTTQSPTSAALAGGQLISIGATAEQAAERLKVVAQLSDALRTAGADIEVTAKVVQLGTSLFADFGETAESVGDKIAIISDTSAVASSTGMQEFLQLFSKAAGLASQLGIGLDELLANFATLRDAGQAPEVAATSMKSLLATIIEAPEKLEDLGVSVFDANNQFIGLTETFGRLGGQGVAVEQLAEVTGALDELEQEGIDVSDTAELFGKIGVASAIALQEGYDKTVAATERLADHQDALQRKSDAINSSIQGQIKLLEGSFQTALVDLGATIGRFTGPATSALLALVNAFIEAPPVVKEFTGATLGLAVAAATAVASGTGLLLAIKGLEAAELGTTWAVVQSAAARTAQSVAIGINTAVTAANTQIRLRDVAASAIQTAATKAQTAATVIQTAATKANIVAAGAAVAPYAALAAGIAGVAAAGALVVNTYRVINAESSQIEASTKLAAEAQLAYMEKLAAAGQAGAEAIDQIQQSQQELFESQLNIFQRGLEAARQSLGLKTAFEASSDAAGIAFDDLINKVGEAEQAYIDLAQEGFTPGSEAALSLVENLEAQRDALNAAQITNEADIAQRDAMVAKLTSYIAKLEGTTEGTEDVATSTAEAGDAAEKAAEQFQKLQDQLAANIATIETDVLRAQAEAYNTLGADKKALEAGLSKIEEDELLKRLRVQRDYLASLETATFESEEAKQKAIQEAANEVAQIELDLARLRSERQADATAEAESAAKEAEQAAEEQSRKAEQAAEEQARKAEQAAEEQARKAEEQARERERQEQEQRRIRQAEQAAAFEEEMRQIERTLIEYRRVTDERIRGQEEILRGYDKEDAAIRKQVESLYLRAEAQDLVFQKRIQETDRHLMGLARAGELLATLNDDEEDSLETRKLAQAELKRLGISTRMTQLELLDRIQKQEEDRRKAELEALMLQQATERAALKYQQQQEVISLRRAATESQIASIKAQQLVLETQIASAQAEQQVRVAAAALAEAQQSGDQVAIIQARTALSQAEESAALVKEQIPLAQQQADLVKEQVAAAEQELEAYSEIAAQQSENLSNQQKLALEAERTADAAERFAAAMERAAIVGTPEATRIVGTVDPVEAQARRFGGPVEAGQVYRVNEAGIEGFRPHGSNQIMPLLQPRNSLFSPTIPGEVLSVPQMNQAGGSVNLAGLKAEIKGLRADLANRPVPTLTAPATFINEPSPLATQIQLLSAQLKAARGML